MTKADPKLQRRFSALIAPVSRAYRRHLDRGLADLSLSHSMALAVMLVGRVGEDGMRQGALADQLGMEAPSVVPIVDQMERAGLVERRVDATDKRARTLHLTETGADLAARTEARATEVRAAVLDGIDAADLAIATAVLEQLARAVEAAAAQD